MIVPAHPSIGEVCGNMIACVSTAILKGDDIIGATRHCVFIVIAEGKLNERV